METLQRIQALLAHLLAGRWVKHEAFGKTKQGKPASMPCFPSTAKAGDIGYAVKRDGSLGFMVLKAQRFAVAYNGETLGAWVVEHLDPRTGAVIGKGTTTTEVVELPE